jgi:hypothetical protein
MKNTEINNLILWPNNYIEYRRTTGINHIEQQAVNTEKINTTNRSEEHRNIDAI